MNCAYDRYEEYWTLFYPHLSFGADMLGLPCKIRVGGVWQEAKEVEDYVHWLCVKFCISDQIEKMSVLKLIKEGVQSAKPELTPYKFVTIGYPHDIADQEFVADVRKWQSTSWIWGSHRIQRFEFFRDSGKRHPHLHMFVYTNKKTSEIIRELSNKTKIDKNFIDVKSGRYHVHLNYINGVKSEQKHEDMQQDAITRNILLLDEVEYFGE